MDDQKPEQTQQPSLLFGVAALVAIAAVLGMMLFGLMSGDDGDDRSPAERQADYERVHAELFPPPTVEYHLTGQPTFVSLTYETPSGTSQAQDVTTPETFTFDEFRSGDFLYLSAQITDTGSRATIECTITVDGEVVSRAHAIGFPSIATCDSRVP